MNLRQPRTIRIFKHKEMKKEDSDDEMPLASAKVKTEEVEVKRES